MCFLLSNHSIKFSPIIGRQTLTLLFPPVEVLAGPPRKTRTLKAATPRHHQIPTTRAVISASAILMTTTASPLPKHTLTETTTIITTTTLQHHHKSRCFYASHLSERHLSGVHSRLSYRCPSIVDQNEWLVLNVFEFYQYLNLFYGVIAEFVTPQTCPTMNAGPGIDYLWIDSNKQPVRLPANTYIDYVLTWISNKFDDPTLFPTKQNVPFPSHFMGVLKNIYRQMFRVLRIFTITILISLYICQWRHIGTRFLHISYRLARTLTCWSARRWSP